MVIRISSAENDKAPAKTCARLSFKLIGLLFFLWLQLTACSSMPNSSDLYSHYSRTQLTKAKLDYILSGVALFEDKNAQTILPEDNILSISEEMKLFIAAYVPARGSDKRKLRSLVGAMHQGVLGLDYNPSLTLPAE